ncbi:MAG: alpha/beta hydrolase [Lentisphaeria bacterium]|nr:alpha/beta hydrolase [Lentisphaeria bacterium]
MLKFENGKAIPLWGEEPPFAKGNEPGKDIPTITLYTPPQWKRYDKAVVIFPGGAYCFCAPHEGQGYAEYLAANGIWAFVVNYRVAPNYAHPVPLNDAARGVRCVRLAAKELGFDPDKVGVMGSSAGGHLAGHISTCFDSPQIVYGKDETEKVSSRPSFSILCYPVISGVSTKRHLGSFLNLLGTKTPSEEDLKKLSLELLVNEKTPKAFLWHTFGDKGVPLENSLLYAEKLREHEIPFALHIYERGGHGMGLNNGHPWGQECLFWLSMI